MADTPERAKSALRIVPYHKPAAGLEAVLSSLRYTERHAGLVRGPLALALVNQRSGFDCPGCAWPEPSQRSVAEFCENGARAVAHEATTRKVDPLFFEEWTLPKLRAQSDHWLEAQGRLTHPMIKRPGSLRYEPLSWEEAICHVAQRLQQLSSPDEAVFYTSGRTSNEAAFLYQLFVREFGTNNLPDCSNMCHESSGKGLGKTIGIGKGTVSLDDFDQADLILVIGQNPGTNHPRMLSTLAAQRARGCEIVSINPLRERALERFAHPQQARGLLLNGDEISSQYIQVRIGGDIALLKGVMKLVFEEEERSPGKVLDHAFLSAHTQGFEDLRRSVAESRWEDLLEESGVSRLEMERLAQVYCRSERVIACWAMGLTQHRFGVANIQEVVNLLLLRGNLGRPGAGVCPVRGHSNVQGDRTMGIWEAPDEAFLTRLSQVFGFTAPRKHGYDVWHSLKAMALGRVRVFVAMGGNFAAATPDTEGTRRALARCELTVQISTKLNRSHLDCGDTAIILPCLGRTERDHSGGKEQFVTVENSMGVVHRSHGRLAPADESLRSEPWIVTALARATFGEGSRVPWKQFGEDYDHIRDYIAQVIPGFEAMNRRVRAPDGFVLRNSARERMWETPSGKAHFTVNPLPRMTLQNDQYLLMTIRTHDQYNTTIYGQDDRYRGLYGERRVVLMNADDMRQAGFEEGQRVDVTSWFGGEERTANAFFALPFDIPRRCLAAYFPEANVLVPRDSVADESQTPTSKSIVVTLAASTHESRG
ncbi:MAG: FdhF/YdeP family oxidoreductase [Myxococcota bacterium]